MWIYLAYFQTPNFFDFLVVTEFQYVIQNPIWCIILLNRVFFFIGSPPICPSSLILFHPTHITSLHFLKNHLSNDTLVQSICLQILPRQLSNIISHYYFFLFCLQFCLLKSETAYLVFKKASTFQLVQCGKI